MSYGKNAKALIDSFYKRYLEAFDNNDLLGMYKFAKEIAFFYQEIKESEQSKHWTEMANDHKSQLPLEVQQELEKEEIGDYNDYSEEEIDDYDKYNEEETDDYNKKKKKKNVFIGTSGSDQQQSVDIIGLIDQQRLIDIGNSPIGSDENNNKVATNKTSENKEFNIFDCFIPNNEKSSNEQQNIQQTKIGSNDIQREQEHDKKYNDIIKNESSIVSLICTFTHNYNKASECYDLLNMFKNADEIFFLYALLGKKEQADYWYGIAEKCFNNLSRDAKEQFNKTIQLRRNYLEERANFLSEEYNKVSKKNNYFAMSRIAFQLSNIYFILSDDEKQRYWYKNCKELSNNKLTKNEYEEMRCFQNEEYGDEAIYKSKLVGLFMHTYRIANASYVYGNKEQANIYINESKNILNQLSLDDLHNLTKKIICSEEKNKKYICELLLNKYYKFFKEAELLEETNKKNSEECEYGILTAMASIYGILGNSELAEICKRDAERISNEMKRKRKPIDKNFYEGFGDSSLKNTTTPKLESNLSRGIEKNLPKHLNPTISVTDMKKEATNNEAKTVNEKKETINRKNEMLNTLSSTNGSFDKNKKVNELNGLDKLKKSLNVKEVCSQKI